MQNHTFYLGVRTPALLAAGETLKKHGYPVVERPCPAVTHLLLGVPTAKETDITGLLDLLSKNVTVVGGYLPSLPGYSCIDLLQNDAYLAGNAAITAHCAIAVALPRLPVTMQECPVLVIGWGRIGKCLAPLLKAMGARVTVAARREASRAMAQALGYKALALEDAPLEDYRLIYNTVPAPMLSAQQLSVCHPGCLKIDLASVLGLEGEDVVWARGLPGKNTPESSGRLIAHTVIHLLAEMEGSI